jgi:cell division control protein 6
MDETEHTSQADDSGDSGEETDGPHGTDDGDDPPPDPSNRAVEANGSGADEAPAVDHDASAADGRASAADRSVDASRQPELGVATDGDTSPDEAMPPDVETTVDEATPSNDVTPPNNVTPPNDATSPNDATPPDAETTADDAVTPDPSVDADTDVNVGSGGRDRSSPDVDLDGVVLDDDDSQGLFDDLLSGEPIFENKEVLRPSYTPHELPHRNDQINRMATILVSALRGETPSNILIYGKTGTGKTASAKFVSQELESTSQKYDVPCEVEYINCEVTDTQYRVLAQLANTFIEKNQQVIADRLDEYRALRSDAVDDSGALAPTEFATLDELDARIEELEADAAEMEEVPMTGWPTDRVYSTFFEAVDYHERVVVIMLDEIDKLVEKSGDDTLYNLSRMNSELTRSRISIMGISNDLKFTDFLDPRVKSSLGEEEIVFPPYDANQLRDILQHRADIAFKQEALTDDVIPLCAAFAAQEHGDARRALDLLRTAGELAERSQAEIVAEKHVRQAQDKIELDRVVEVVRTLPTQSKIVLFAVILLEKNGVHNINTGEVFNIYKRLCEEIDADVLTQRRVTDLISELDMLGIVNAVVVSKGRYGRTKEMGLSVPVEETEAVLLSDSRLGDIENAQPFVQARFDN